VPRMSNGDWFPLDQATHPDGYQVNMLATMSATGAGRAVLLHLRNHETAEVAVYVLDPDFAGQVGWDLVGVSTGWLDNAYGDRLLPDDPEVRDNIRRLLTGEDE
jgi:hypothetical protein